MGGLAFLVQRLSEKALTFGGNLNFSAGGYVQG